MSDVFAVFTENILPILIVAGFGFALRRFVGLEKQPIARLTFFVFSPCLLFSKLVGSTIPAGELVRLAGFALVSLLAMGAIAAGFGRILRFNRQQTIVLVLAAMFGNVGNFGLSLNELRYGSDGLAAAIPYYTVEAMLVWTVGVLIASMGESSFTDSLKGLFKLPAIYAVVAALVVTATAITVPEPLFASIDIAGRGAIPVMLVILGMQMADVKQLDDIRLAVPAVGLRLLIGPLVGLALIPLFQIQGLNYSASMLQSSVPVAVATIVLATEYNVLPRAMTTTVVLSTLLAPFTLVTVIQLLGL